MIEKILPDEMKDDLLITEVGRGSRPRFKRKIEKLPTSTTIKKKQIKTFFLYPAK